MKLENSIFTLKSTRLSRLRAYRVRMKKWMNLNRDDIPVLLQLVPLLEISAGQRKFVLENYEHLRTTHRLFADLFPDEFFVFSEGISNDSTVSDGVLNYELLKYMTGLFRKTNSELNHMSFDDVLKPILIQKLKKLTLGHTRLDNLPKIPLDKIRRLLRLTHSDICDWCYPHPRCWNCAQVRSFDLMQRTASDILSLSMILF